MEDKIKEMGGDIPKDEFDASSVRQNRQQKAAEAKALEESKSDEENSSDDERTPGGAISHPEFETETGEVI